MEKHPILQYSNTPLRLLLKTITRLHNSFTDKLEV